MQDWVLKQGSNRCMLLLTNNRHYCLEMNFYLRKEVYLHILTLSNLHPPNKSILTSNTCTGVNDSSILVFKETLGLTVHCGLAYNELLSHFTFILFPRLNSCNPFLLSEFPSYFHRA